MILSKSIREYCTSDVCREYFLNFEGQVIQLPARFLPDQVLLAKHRNSLIV